MRPRAQMCLPKATHRIPDEFQHLKISGVPYAAVNSVNEQGSMRSFFADPDWRDLRRAAIATVEQPTVKAMQIVDAALADNPLVRSLVNWATADTPTAHLHLKWPGSTTCVRAFTVMPATSEASRIRTAPNATARGAPEHSGTRGLTTRIRRRRSAHRPLHPRGERREVVHQVA